MEKISLKENSIEKPPFLYHGSPNKELEEFEPQPNSFVGVEGNFFFASPDRNAAIPYMWKGSSWSAGPTENGGCFAAFATTREEFIKRDTGGALYVFEPEHFSSHLKKSNYEWVTDQKVKPIAKEIFNSVLDEMEKAGTEIYFLGSVEKWNEYKSLTAVEKRNFLKNLV